MGDVTISNLHAACWQADCDRRQLARDPPLEIHGCEEKGASEEAVEEERAFDLGGQPSDRMEWSGSCVKKNDHSNSGSLAYSSGFDEW